MKQLMKKPMKKKLRNLVNYRFGVIKNEEVEIDKFCNNDSCEVIPMTMIMMTKIMLN